MSDRIDERELHTAATKDVSRSSAESRSPDEGRSTRKSDATSQT